MTTLADDTTVTTRRPRTLSGLAFALVSAASFGMSGALARGLLDDGWTPGAVVLARIALAARRGGAVRGGGAARSLAPDARPLAHRRGLRPGRRGGHAVLLLLGRLPHGGRARAADRVHRSRRHRGVAVAATRRAARPADPGRCRRGGARPGAGARPALRGGPERAGCAVVAGRDGRLRDVLRDVRRRGQRPASAGPRGRRDGRRRTVAGRPGRRGGARDGGVHVLGRAGRRHGRVVGADRAAGRGHRRRRLRHRHRRHPSPGLAPGVVRGAGRGGLRGAVGLGAARRAAARRCRCWAAC